MPPLQRQEGMKPTPPVLLQDWAKVMPPRQQQERGKPTFLLRLQKRVNPRLPSSSRREPRARLSPRARTGPSPCLSQAPGGVRAHASLHLQQGAKPTPLLSLVEVANPRLLGGAMPTHPPLFHVVIWLRYLLCIASFCSTFRLGGHNKYDIEECLEI